MAKFDPEVVLEFYAKCLAHRGGSARHAFMGEGSVDSLWCRCPQPVPGWPASFGGGPTGLTRRPLPSCYAHRGRISPGPLQGGECGSCAPTWQPWPRRGWHCCSAMSCLAIITLIADAIYLFAGMPPTRHPLDPDKSNRALGFPALITGLCQSFGVPVTIVFTTYRLVRSFRLPCG